MSSYFTAIEQPTITISGTDNTVTDPCLVLQEQLNQSKDTCFILEGPYMSSTLSPHPEAWNLESMRPPEKTANQKQHALHHR